MASASYVHDLIANILVYFLPLHLAYNKWSVSLLALDHTAHALDFYFRIGVAKK